MKISDLSQALGISRQMIGKLKKRGMPVDSLESAIAWRKSNIDPFRTKTGRIGGNSGVKYPPVKVSQSHEIERKAIEETLTKIVPNLYFERVDWLANAIKDAGVTVTGAQVMDIQDNLFVTYLEELIYKRFQINSSFDLPPLASMRTDSEEHKLVIESLNKILSADKTA